MRATFWVLLIVLFYGAGHAAKAPVPKDALVLDKPVIVRQFPDANGAVLAKLQPCDELVVLDSPSHKKGAYISIVFLSEDAQKIRRGWIRQDSSLYIFPEPRPALPRTDTTPETAFPWDKKAPQPGDPDYARVTSKSFLFACLNKPHPTKVAAVLTQMLDRYAGELTLEEVKILLPLLKFARDTDYARIRELLKPFKNDPEVAAFISANPIFGEVIEPEEKPAPIMTALPTVTPEETSKFSPKLIGIGVLGVAAGLILIALVLRSRKKKRPEPLMPSDEPTFTDTTDHGQGPSI